jgi:hypothetical protein
MTSVLLSRAGAENLRNQLDQVLVLPDGVRPRTVKVTAVIGSAALIAGIALSGCGSSAPPNTTAQLCQDWCTYVNHGNFTSAANVKIGHQYLKLYKHAQQPARRDIAKFLVYNATAGVNGLVKLADAQIAADKACRVR